MRASIVITVLDSHEIVRRQLQYLETIVPPDVELVLVDDGPASSSGVEMRGSRMCTLEEALNTADPPLLDTYVPAGWVRDDAMSREPVVSKNPIEPVPDPGAEPVPAPQNNGCLG